MPRKAHKPPRKPTRTSDPASKLDRYRAKRSPGATPEPFGEAAVERPGLFVVQQHAARRLHYDLRLEIGGVLKSWAVPKGPSLDPADKRLAVHTEDHPLEYGDFEGIIPPDNYGAGAVIVWDRGLSLHELDPEEGLDSGKLLFELRGYKLRGLFTLVKTKRAEKEWLLIKKPDAAATGQTAEELGAESVFSGLTVEELRDGESREQEILERLEKLGARRRSVDPRKVKVMLARLRDAPFSRPGWLFELKYDGYRVLAALDRSAGRRPYETVRLHYRSGREATASYPDLVRALGALPYRSLLLDGEVVVLDEKARPSFQRLQKRARLSRPLDVERAAVGLPAALFCFDLLAFGGYDLRALPLVERKALLQRLLPRAGPIRFADHVAERGEELYAEVRRAGVEGVVAKKSDAPYRGGRSPHWIKVRAGRTGDFAVVGYTRPQGARPGFGALHLAVLHGAKLLYVGRVGSGFTDRQLTEIRARLDTARRREPACDGAPAGRAHTWVEPQIVAEVKFTEYTEEGLLRHPVFVRLRPDKRVEDCERDDLPPEADPGGGGAARPERPPEVEITRPRKVFWPEDGYTKGDLIAYYRDVSPWLLPYLEDRPLVLTRYPDGIEGKSFFQKNAPEFAPDWIRTEAVWSEDSPKESRYFVCDDVETLVYLINSGAIPLHVWSSRVRALQRPDWSILDIDAKDAPFSSAVAVAREIHKVCRSIELECFVKTSGASGLHVLIPLAAALTFEQSRQLAELLARVVVARRPDLASIARLPASRQGLVYIDALQNGYGKLLVAPFSVRPLPGAPVSMPLRWREVGPRLDPKAFHLENAAQRLRRMRREPLAAVLSTRPDLTRALEALLELL